MKLASNVTAASVDTDPVFFESQDRGIFRPLQVDISSAATVSVQGRNAPDMNWIEVASFTATGADSVMVFREMRTQISGNDGSVTVDIDA